MKIVADEGIAQVEVFQSLGELLTLPAREINAEHVKDADALLIRSVTKVNEALLQGSTVKFVASTTSGFDHVDMEYLKAQEIFFQYAPGSNARSVVEYVFSAIASLSQKQKFDWRACSVGIIGAGNIGGLLANYLRKLGINFLIYDPFLTAESEHAKELSSFEQVLQQDILSLHTPLTLTGEFPTQHLFNSEVINGLAPGKILINAARGAVVDNQALLTRMEKSNDLKCVLDVWENEPAVNLALLRQIEMGTAHIAGYSQTGKLRGMRIAYQALCEYFSLENGLTAISGNIFQPNADNTNVANLSCDLEKFNHKLTSAYDIKQDYLAMLGLLESQNPAQLFDRLRKEYPVRIEYSSGESLPAC